MTRHTPEYLNARASVMSLRSLAAQQAMEQAMAALQTPSTPDRATEKKVHAKELDPKDFTQPYLEFMTGQPTVFHATAYFKETLSKAGYTEVSGFRPFATESRNPRQVMFANRTFRDRIAPKSRELGRQTQARRQVLRDPQWQLHHSLCRRQGVQARQRPRHDRWSHRRPHRPA